MTNAAAATPAKPQKKQGFIAETVEIIKTVFYALLIALVLRVVLFQPYTIPSASEEPNLFRGDYIIVSKWSYGWSQKSAPFLDLIPPIVRGRLFFQPPKRGDIIVFALPHDGHTNFIKRLVGLPGDKIQVRGGRLFINGAPLAVSPAPLPEPPVGISAYARKGQAETNPEGRRYLTQVSTQADLSSADSPNNTGVYVVPPHCYFMMGDNRDDSLDSRFDPLLADSDPKLSGCGVSPAALMSEGSNPGVGFVPEDNLIGKAQLVLISWNTGPDDTQPCCASLFKPWTWITDVRLDRMFRLLD